VRLSVLLIPTPWLYGNQLYYGTQNGLSPAESVVASLGALTAYLLAMIVLCWGVVPVAKWALRLRSVLGLELVCFSAGGVVRATVMILAANGGTLDWSQWGWLSLSWALNTGIWVTASAVLVSWWHQARAQRVRLEAEYERQILSRSEDARALAETDQRLREVREHTRASLAEIEDRLEAEMTATQLDDCIALIDEVVAGSVRPTSHDLARLEDDLEPIRVDPLWPSRRELIPAIIRAWPKAHPFQPALVGMLCLPMVMVAEVVPPPHRFGASSSVSIVILGLQVLLLWGSNRILAPRVARMPARSGASVVFAIYLVLYLLGLTTLIIAMVGDNPTPLEAFLVPALLAMIAGGISAFARIREDESAAARSLIRRTNWEVHRTRQRLWARRRRLATALHGRVQANLTAASLILGGARDQLKSGAALDAEVVERVRSTVALANPMEEAPSDSPQQRLDTVTSVWAGVLDVSLDLRPGGLAMMDTAPDLTDACVEVVREILLNSVRHSGATQAEVVIGSDQRSVLGIRVREMNAARTPLGAIGGPGLGRTLIDSLAVDWAESDGEEGRLTVALLAAGAGGVGELNASSLLGDVNSLK
jgi:signal transduction histidine kinase